MLGAVVAGILLAVAACDRVDEHARYQGVVELDEHVLGFEVPGRIVQLAVDRGDVVEVGQLLATLDDSQQRVVVAERAAGARAAAQQAKLVAAGARREDVRATEAQLRSARATEAHAAKLHRDNLDLVEKGALPRAVADDSEAELKTAIGEREALEQRLRELRVGSRTEEIAGAAARAVAAEAAVEVEQDRARRFELYAPIAGEVLDRHVELGEVVAAGSPVVTIGDTTQPYVDVFVPQQRLAGIRVGTAARVGADGLRMALRGLVEHVSRQTEFTPRFIFSPRERANLVVRVRVRVEDPTRALHAGIPATVAFGD